MVYLDVEDWLDNLVTMVSQEQKETKVNDKNQLCFMQMYRCDYNNTKFYDLGWRGDDCGFCPPGLPGVKGDTGESGKIHNQYLYNVYTIL